MKIAKKVNCTPRLIASYTNLNLVSPFSNLFLIEKGKVVRTRAEMPGFPQGMTNDAFWKKYQNERMVELAFEGHRFWDVRRWKEGDKHFKNIVEMKITKNGDDTYTYERKVKERSWDDKMYFFPIPQSEKSKNPNLEQNPGW